MVASMALGALVMIGPTAVVPAAVAEALMLVKPSVPWSVTGGDDIMHLKSLAAGVGWEFEPNAETTAALRRIGIKTIRCINVDPLPGEFTAQGDFMVGDPGPLNRHLLTCQQLAARPHVVIGVGVHPDLRVRAEDVETRDEALMGLVRSASFGPRDWGKFRKYCQAVYEYVLVTKGFPEAQFEVGNEPDIGGTVHPFPPRPANGSRALYEGYLELYRNCAAAAQDFEASHPGLKVRLGGPAVAWAFTFRYGDFNWADRFVEDCGRQGLKLDFIGVHYYGNISSLDGAYEANYPPFTAMLRQLQAARDRWTPGVPIMLTEWGPSYRSDLSDDAAVNANHIGAAWCAEFLHTLLSAGVEGALYLVTTDLRQQMEDGSWQTVWGWPSLFANPIAVGKTVPKAPFHVFDMIARLQGQRVEATRGGATVNGIAAVDRSARRMHLLTWNFGAIIPEAGVAMETAQREAVTVRVREAADFFGAASVRAERWLVSRTQGNAHGLFKAGEELDHRTQLQKVDSGLWRILDNQLDVGFAMPPCSVALLELSPADPGSRSP